MMSKEIHSKPNIDVYVLLSLCTLLTIPTYFYGLRVLIVAGVALATALITELFLNKFFSVKRKKYDLSAYTTAMIIALIMPASVGYYVVIIAVFLGLLVGKYVFGANDKHIFNPAALGAAIVAISFPEEVLRFPEISTGTQLPFDMVITQGVIYQTSPASILNVGGTPSIHIFDLFLGNYVGAMGATCVIVLMAVAMFLIITRSISFLILFSNLLTVGVYAILFPRVATGLTNSFTYEMTSGILIFGLIFLICDKRLAPKTSFGKILYGVFVALLTMVYRTIGALDVEIVFVVLVANALSVEFDVWANALLSLTRIGGNKNKKSPVKSKEVL